MIFGNALIAARQGMITPFRKANIGPASYDVTLGDSFIIEGFSKDAAPWWYRILRGVLCIIGKVPESKVTPDGVVIAPFSFLLATTEEKISLGLDVCAYVEGRSSWGRKGLFVENAGFCDPGFEGTITLELLNVSRHPLKLETGGRIAQLVFHGVVGCTEGYGDRAGSKYQGQVGATKSRISQESVFEDVWAR